ncbi:MAG TPA: GntR family transcriptional regulator [Gemmatimonadaceae bacterium]|nr:GntR family transcriptional regulator [Gemmatimonadaceae bacterium]
MATRVYSSLFGGAYESLRTLIVRGRLAPGTPMVEAEVAIRLGISRTPIREALRQLRSEGLLVSVGGGERPRLVVAPLSRTVLLELYRATGALEGVAARNITDLPVSDRKALASTMIKVDRDFRTAANARNADWDRLFDLHDSFHRALRAACAGPAVTRLLDALRPQVDRYEWFFAQLTGPDFSPTFAEHEAITREIRGGTASGIERAVRANWFNGGDRLAAAIGGPNAADAIGSAWDLAMAAAGS